MSDRLPVVVTGPPGAGKTTLARLLAARLEADLVCFAPLDLACPLLERDGSQPFDVDAVVALL